MKGHHTGYEHFLRGVVSTEEVLLFLNWAVAEGSTLDLCMLSKKLIRGVIFSSVNIMVYALDRSENKFRVCKCSISR